MVSRAAPDAFTSCEPLHYWPKAKQTPNMSSEKFTILRVTAADASKMRAVSKRANATNIVQQAFYPKHLEHLTPREEIDAWQTNTLKEMINAGKARYFKAVLTDEPDRLVALTGWFPPAAFDIEALDKQSANVAPGASTEAKKEPYNPACRDDAVRDDYIAKMNACKKAIWGEDTDYWYVSALNVDPDFQRQGLGARLLAEGLKLVDATHKPVYLESGPAAEGFYKKMGFEAKGEWEMCEGKYVATGFVREAR